MSGRRGVASEMFPMGFTPRVRAVLGPTNTGKTHLATERLLAHRTGIIGFPLRLLARENYDRMVAAKGERFVALITGEEKIVPPEARWFSCTVEAMPLDRDAEFVAIDEIQLCADPDRGHVFTDRLLHARGLVETMVMGAETIRPLLERLVPGVSVETRPRLSQLAGVGHQKLARLPPRSAIVAFSAGEVYAIAEAIRRRRGGCAVVMGRLSPRTRNAQVALYQEKEVDFLVATDAIGMGLNMDVNHVAFAGLSKFDGSRPRPLQAPEIAQIAGRAGRGMRDGTFGTTGHCAPLAPPLVEAVEQHRFDPLEALAWRSSALDMSNPDALLASLLAPPPAPGLVRGNEASDLETLQVLARDPEIRARCGDRARTRLLWEACQVPDFRKLADDTHARLCARIFRHVVEDGTLPPEWIESNLASLARADGDIDTLMSRLSGVRVWSFIAARKEWTDGSDAFTIRARVVEDLLSDALHERLTARFVDRRAALLVRRLAEDNGEKLLSAVTGGGEVVVEGQVVGHTRGFAFHPDPLLEGEGLKLAERAARRAMRDDTPRRVAALVAAPDAEFAVDEAAQGVTWRGQTVAVLRRGRSVLEPGLEPVSSEFLDGAERERIRARVAGLVAATIERHLQPLTEAAARADATPALRGILHTLREAGGFLPGPTHALVDADSRTALRALGVRAGRFALFLPALVKPRPTAFRAMLLAVAEGRPTPVLPMPGLVSVPSPPDAAARAVLQALGWVETGPVLLRIDTAERIAGELAFATRRRPHALIPGLASRLGLKGEFLPDVLRAVGIRLLPASDLAADAFGPPAPPMMSSLPPPTADRRRSSRHAARDDTRPASRNDGRHAASRDRRPAANGERDAATAVTAAAAPEGPHAAAPRPAAPADQRHGGPHRTRHDGPKGPPAPGKREPGREAGREPGREPHRPRPAPAPPAFNPDSPFAALAALRRVMR